MKKFTFFLMSLFFMLGTTVVAQNYVPAETRISSEELNAKTAPTLIAIKNLSATNNYYFVGNTGAAPYSKAEFSNDAVFVWQPVTEGVAGSYYLMKLDGTYMQATSPKDFGTVDGAAVFTTTNPTTDNGEFSGDGDSKDYIDDQALLVRFTNDAGTWINVQNGDGGTPVYNSGKGGWTIHYIYAVEESAVEPEPEPEPEPEVVIPAADKSYTVVAEGHNSGAKPQWAINDEGTKFVSSGDNTISTEEQKQFAFVTFNEAKYIYSISAKKFVLKDGSLAEKTGDAVEITDLGNGKYFFRFDANHNVNIGGSKQMVIDSWSAVDGGNQFTLIEAGEFDPAEALAALNSVVEVVYVYMYNGVEVGRVTVKDEIGNAYPAALNVPYGFTANAPEGTIEGAGEVTIECALTDNYPIKYAASVEEIDTWYYIQMHSNNKRYIQYLADQTYLEWADAEVAAGEEDTYTWAFVGDPANGFKLVNYAAGKEMAVCSDGTTAPVLGAFADAVVWKPNYARDSNGPAYFCLQFPGGDYMNAQNGKVAYWWDNDAGSALLLTERVIEIEPEPVALAVVSQTPAADEVVESFNSITIEFNKAIEFIQAAGGTDGTGGTGGTDGTGGTGGTDGTGGTSGPAQFIKLKDANGGVAATAWVSAATIDGNKVTFTFEMNAAVTKTGTYTFEIPAGLIKATDGEEFAGQTFTFQVQEPKVETFAVTANLFPTVQGDVTEIKGISVEANQGASLSDLPTAWTLTNEAGKEYDMNILWLNDFIDVLITFNPAITEAGTYTLTIPAGSLKTDDGKECEAATFSWTIISQEPEEIDDTPYHNGVKNSNDRNITGIKLYSNTHGESAYSLTSDEANMDYTDKINAETPAYLVAAPGETVQLSVIGYGEWIHHYVYVDFAGDGFTAGIAEDGYTPTGDLVAYSFYNNGSDLDEFGYNSDGQSVTGGNRNRPALPMFTVPTETGEYRMRIKQDWSNIDPRGDNDGKFGDFKDNRGQIVDVILVVTNEVGINGINAENVVKGIYDLQGRKIEEITESGIYIIDGKKVLVK